MNCQCRTSYVWDCHLPFFQNIKCLCSSLTHFRNQLAFLLLTIKLGLPGKQWLENRSLIVRKSERATHTQLYRRLIPLITPSRGTWLPWQQTRQRRQVCCVTFCPAFMSFYHKSFWHLRTSPSIVLCHNRVKHTVQEIRLTANHQGRLLAKRCSWTEVEPRGG